MMRLVHCGILLLSSLWWRQSAGYGISESVALAAVRLAAPAAPEDAVALEEDLKSKALMPESAIGEQSRGDLFLEALKQVDFNSAELSVAAAGVTTKVGVDQNGEVEAGVGIGAGPASAELSVSKENTSLKGEFNFELGLLRLKGDITKIFYFDQPHNNITVKDVNEKQLEDFMDSRFNTILHGGGRVLLLSSDYWVYKDGAFVVKKTKSKGLGPFKYVTTKELIGDEMQRTEKKFLFTPKITFTVGTADVGMSAVIDLSKTLGWSKEYDLMSGDKSGEVPSSGPHGTFKRLNSEEIFANYIKHQG